MEFNKQLNIVSLGAHYLTGTSGQGETQAGHGVLAT